MTKKWRDKKLNRTIEYKGKVNKWKVKGKEKRLEFRNEEDERRAVCGSDDDDFGPQVIISCSNQFYSDIY